jgi:hypothetical protein
MRIVRIPLVVLSFVLLADCLAPAFAQSVTRAKTMFVRGLPPSNDPISLKVMDGITELRSNGGSLPNVFDWETASESNDDWITHLSFAIKNVSEKRITCIIVFSVFPEAPFWQGNSTPVSASVLGLAQNRVGRRPDAALHSDGRTLPPDTDAPFKLAPGEEFTMSIEDPKDYPKLKANIERRMPISNVMALDSGTITVFFDDGTRWVSINHSYSRPSAPPGKWTKIPFEEWIGK